MFLEKIELQNFRNNKKSIYSFAKTNIIIGKNTIGKTNILEAIYFLSHGTSFRAEKDHDVIKIGEAFAKVEGSITEEENTISLITNLIKNNGYFHKKYLVNKVPKRQLDFTSKILTVLFTPSDVEIITDSPTLRRKYFDSILFQASRRYKHALVIYEKAIRNRNRMLFNIKEGRKVVKKEEFDYWDNLLIENGEVVTNERKRYVDFINDSKKTIFDLRVIYDKSTITRERLDKYFEVEQKVGVTLVGPQRDEFVFTFPNTDSNLSLRKTPTIVEDDEAISNHLGLPRSLSVARNDMKTNKTIKEFGSRGEQRLSILQLKLLEIEFLKIETGKNPILLLDDIFSELDNENIEKVLELVELCQTIITTTHKEFVPKKIANKINLIELK